MMLDNSKLFVTGSTGQLGQLVVDALLKRVPADAIIAGARDPDSEAAARLRDKGVGVRAADYDRPDTLLSALDGVDRLLLISGSEIGSRTVQHGNVIAAAKAAGVRMIAYTSILHADTSPLFLAHEHRHTEAALVASGLPFVLLRNGWYTEVFTWRLPNALKHGVFMGAASNGRISSASRADYAEAAAAVLASGDRAGRVYELAGDTAFTLADLVTAASETAEKTIVYQDMSPDKFRLAASEAGVPELFAKVLSDTDAGIAKGALFDEGGDLARLIDRPTTDMSRTITAFIANMG